MSALFNAIKNTLQKLPINNSEAEVSLSVGESLLLVIAVCERERVDENLLIELKLLYLEGTKNEEEKGFVRKITQLFLDKNFNVKPDPKTVSDDPGRRYFETNLAYYILQSKAESLATIQLEKFTQNLKKRLFSLPGIDPQQRLKAEKILKGDMDDTLLNKYELEYAELTHKLLKQDYHGLSEKACKNLYQIACNTILATLNTQIDKSMPLDIYSDSIFSMGMDGRGRVVKGSHDEVRTTAKGLMKSTSPLPMYDDLVNPVTKDYSRDEFSPIQRSSDQAGFMIESEWCQHLFSRQTQPYANGISSTTLAQIRNIILQKRVGNPYFKGGFQQYISAFSSLMIYNSGGHSFFEIFEVLKLSLCKELLDEEAELSEALKQDRLMSKVLYHDHREEFESALKATQSYTQTLLQKKLPNAQIKKRKTEGMELTSQPKGLDETAGLNLIHNAVLNLSAEELDKLLHRQSKNVNALNHKGWSPLMVAAQLGKTEHVRALLKAGARINKQAEGLSSLALAIKSQKFATVEVLLQAGAQIKKSNTSKGNIKKRAPALYLACRQNDMRILNAILGREHFNIDDKKNAILVALRIENVEALKVLMAHLTLQEKQHYFSTQYKSSLLKEAVALGSIQLIDEITKLDIHPSSNIHYNELLQISAIKGFLPTAKHLLGLARRAQEPKPIIDMDKALELALENNHFDMAIVFIIYGANPESIPTSGNYLRAFNLYLQSAEHFDFMFTEEDVVTIQERKEAIKETIANRQNSYLHRFLSSLIDFLNRILPNSLRLGYNDKTEVIKSVDLVFDNKNRADSVKRTIDQFSLFGKSSPEKQDNTPGNDLEHNAATHQIA